MFPFDFSLQLNFIDEQYLFHAFLLQLFEIILQQ